MSMKSHTVLATAMFAALWFGTSNASASGHGTVTLDHFTYTLTDLDPNDGIGPSITFLPMSGAPGNTAFLQMEYAFGPSSGPLIKRSVGTESISLEDTRSPTMALSASASGLNSLATTSLSASLRADNDSYLGTLSSSAWSGTEVFVLSPHTELSVIATGHFSGAMAPNAYSDFSLGAEIRLEPEPGRLISFDADYGSNSSSGPISFDQIMHVVGAYANDSDANLTGTLQMVVSTQADGFGGPITSPVPEPAQAAMYAAGLGLLLARRRNNCGA
jgi:hypothetical protein